MTTVSLQAWRTELHLSVRGAVDEDLLDGRLRGAVARLDAAASRFRPDSEVLQLTRRAGTWVPVSDLLLDLVRAAKDAAEATGGLVHPGLGSVVAGAGYDAWAGQPTPIAGTGGVLPWQDIEIDPHGAVRIPAGMVLDLGATAKAWLADALARDMAAATGFDVLANMGGDIRCMSNGEGWTVWLDPELLGVEIVGIQLRNAGVATSGVARRRWAGGHHIIDPRTAAPARTPWWSAAVVAADALGANTAATAAMVLGAEAPAWLSGQGLTARLLIADGTETRIGPWAGQESAA